MRVLITGGTGFIGSRLAFALLEDGDSYSTERMRAFLTQWATDTTPSK